jgi:hypothetical protein
MKNKLQYIKNSWTYNHKLLIIALSLATAHVFPLIPLPNLVQAETIEYTKPPQINNSLQAQIEQRAVELHEQNKAIDLEKYRHKAIEEKNLELQSMVKDSPFVDYDELKAKYGY